MTTACALVVVTSIICLVFIPNEGDSFNNFEILIKLTTTIALYLAYRNYNWDVAKGLMGGVLFCIMYQEAYLVLGKLWGEEDFDTYLIVRLS